jgi:hypothetical protein
VIRISRLFTGACLIVYLCVFTPSPWLISQAFALAPPGLSGEKAEALNQIAGGAEGAPKKTMPQAPTKLGLLLDVDDTTIQSLIYDSSDPMNRVRAEAERTLWRLGGRSKSALLQAVKGPDLVVQTDASMALRHTLSDSEFLDLLLRPGRLMIQRFDDLITSGGLKDPRYIVGF